MCHLPFWSQFSKNIFIWSHWITNSVSNFWPWNKKLRVYKIKTFALHLHFEFARPVRIYMRWFSNSCGVTKEFWWWMASWQHGPSEGLGFSSCSLLFISFMEISSLILQVPSFLFFFSPFSSVQITVSLRHSGKTKLNQARNPVKIGISCWPGKGCWWAPRKRKDSGGDCGSGRYSCCLQIPALLF